MKYPKTVTIRVDEQTEKVLKTIPHGKRGKILSSILKHLKNAIADEKKRAKSLADTSKAA